MRIVTWNCNSSLSRKLEKLIELKPDVAVVQECEEEPSGLPDGASYLWFGHNPRKGLGVKIGTDLFTLFKLLFQLILK